MSLLVRFSIILVLDVTFSIILMISFCERHFYGNLKKFNSVNASFSTKAKEPPEKEMHVIYLFLCHPKSIITWTLLVYMRRYAMSSLHYLYYKEKLNINENESVYHFSPPLTTFTLLI